MGIGNYKIDIELMEAISYLNMNGTQWKIFMTILINQLNNPSAPMSLTILSESISCGVRQTTRELKKLIKRNIVKIVEKEDSTTQTGRVLNINLNHEEWIN